MILPTVIRPQWTTVAAPNLTTDSPGWSGYCLIQSFGTGLLTKTGSRVRVTFKPASTGSNFVIASAYIGMAGTAPSFDGNQAQLLFNGSGGVTVTAGGASVVSDPVNVRVTSASPLLVAVGITSGDTIRNISLTSDYLYYFKAAASGEPPNTSKSGYSNLTSSGILISSVEILR